MKLSKEVIDYIFATQSLMNEIKELMDVELIDPFNGLKNKLNKCNNLYVKMMIEYITDGK